MKPIVRIPGDEAVAAAERAAAILASDPNVRLVYLFGSAADVARSAVRDVDLAVLTDVPMSLDRLLRLQADLRASVGAAIEIVSLNDPPVVLAHEIAETGRCLYAKDADVEVDFVTRARSRYWDFKPFLEEQWRVAGERLAARGSQS
ncbi:MAG: uncharacterized protein QOD06_3211 [Candidatus Binatota bacterium]|nr:uncharacterized protein [Candidatus Binatota bacterium]